MLFSFFNDTPTPDIYTLSLHDALPISGYPRFVQERHGEPAERPAQGSAQADRRGSARRISARHSRSEEHTSELQSQSNLVCRLLLEKKNNIQRDRRSCVT